MRRSGILMPIFSLPAPFGIGGLGREAYEWIDFLARAGQRCWQMLPIGHTGFADSPYQSFSAFACNPYFIDPGLLSAAGLLTEEEIDAERACDTPGTVDYGRLYRERYALLRKAAKRMKTVASAYSGFTKYARENADWLPEYALFMAIKGEQGGVSFREWPAPLREREPAALEAAEVRLADEIYVWSAVQYLFRTQWNDLREYAAERSVVLIGDMPIYVAPDSVEAWALPELFLPSDTLVAGCPPDAFSEDGQLWGNPLYDWEYCKRTDYTWWRARLRQAFFLFDEVRIDHFRGFSGYYAVPADDLDARNGHWCAGPGKDFIAVIREAFPDNRIIAEDLGFLTDDVRALLAYSGLPGMKVLQFAFQEGSEHLPHLHKKNSVIYTSTHDNDTLRGWAESRPREVAFADAYLGGTGDIVSRVIGAALASVGDTVIIPLQDWLGVGSAARINTPATAEGNWRWRLRSGELPEALAGKICALTRLHGRENAR